MHAIVARPFTHIRFAYSSVHCIFTGISFCDFVHFAVSNACDIFVSNYLTIACFITSVRRFATLISCLTSRIFKNGNQTFVHAQLIGFYDHGLIHSYVRKLLFLINCKRILFCSNLAKNSIKRLNSKSQK